MHKQTNTTTKCATRRAAAVVVSLLLAASALPAGAAMRTLSLPDYEANPGAAVEVPLEASGFGDVVGAQVQINYDPALLSISGIRPGEFGQNYELVTSDDSRGIASLLLVAGDAPPAAAGILAIIEFQVNPGASPGLVTDIAVAGFELSDSTAVSGLSSQDEAGSRSGRLTITESLNIDNHDNGLPDQWEQRHGLDPFQSDAANVDRDGDGLVALFEYLTGGDPKRADSAEYGPQYGAIADPDGEGWLPTMSYRRRQGSDGERLSVWESGDLSTWWILDPATQMPEPPEGLGGGFERVTLVGTLRYGEGGSDVGFLQLRAR